MVYQRFTSLNEEDLEFLKAHTQYDFVTIESWYKSFKKDCPDGRLTPEMYIKTHKQFFPTGNAEQFSEHIFRTFDTDKNGYLDFKEFLLAINIMSAGTPEEKLKWAFRVFDVAGNNLIYREEMIKIVRFIYAMSGANFTNVKESPEERAESVFSWMDENEDGHLTEEEFVQYCLHNDELLKMLNAHGMTA